MPSKWKTLSQNEICDYGACLGKRSGPRLGSRASEARNQLRLDQFLGRAQKRKDQSRDWEAKRERVMSLRS